MVDTGWQSESAAAAANTCGLGCAPDAKQKRERDGSENEQPLKYRLVWSGLSRYQ